MVAKTRRAEDKRGGKEPQPARALTRRTERPAHMRRWTSPSGAGYCRCACALVALTASPQMRNRSLFRPSDACARAGEPSLSAGDAVCACARVVIHVSFQAPPSPSPLLVVVLLSEPARSGLPPPPPTFGASWCPHHFVVRSQG